MHLPETQPEPLQIITMEGFANINIALNVCVGLGYGSTHRQANANV